MTNKPNAHLNITHNNLSNSRSRKRSFGYTVHLIGLHVTVAVLCVPVLIVLLWLVKHLTFKLFADATSFFFNLALPAVACVLAVCVSALSNPMHALLSLVGVFLATVLFYVSAGIEFIGLVFLIVYVGAVAILFLFVIMLLNVKSLTPEKTLVTHTTQTVALFFGGLLAVRLFFELADTLGRTTSSAEVKHSHVGDAHINIDEKIYYEVMYRASDVNAIAPLYTEHVLLFWITTANLLLALIGAIILATSTTEQPVKLVPVLADKNSQAVCFSWFVYLVAEIAQDFDSVYFGVYTTVLSTFIQNSAFLPTMYFIHPLFTKVVPPRPRPLIIVQLELPPLDGIIPNEPSQLPEQPKKNPSRVYITAIFIFLVIILADDFSEIFNYTVLTLTFLLDPSQENMLYFVVYSDYFYKNVVLKTLLLLVRPFSDAVAVFGSALELMFSVWETGSWNLLLEKLLGLCCYIGQGIIDHFRPKLNPAVFTYFGIAIGFLGFHGYLHENRCDYPTGCCKFVRNTFIILVLLLLCVVIAYFWGGHK